MAKNLQNSQFLPIFVIKTPLKLEKKNQISTHKCFFFQYCCARIIWFFITQGMFSESGFHWGKRSEAAAAQPSAAEIWLQGRQMRPMNPTGDPRSYHGWSVERPMNSLS